MRLHGLVAEHQPLGDLVIPPVAVTDPEAARAIVGTALLLTSYGLLALGVGTIVRHSGGTIASGVGGIFLPFLFLGAYPDHIARRIQQFTPLAGMAVQSTTDRMMAPIRRQGRHADRALGRSRRRLRLGARSARRRVRPAARPRCVSSAQAPTLPGDPFRWVAMKSRYQP